MTENPAFHQKEMTELYNVVAALAAVVDSGAFSSVDKQKLVALVQRRQSSVDDDGELSAPSAASHKSHSSDIIDALIDFLDKAQTSSTTLFHAESNVAHNFEILEQSFEDLLAQDNKALEKAKTDKTEFMTALEAEKAVLSAV